MEGTGYDQKGTTIPELYVLLTKATRQFKSKFWIVILCTVVFGALGVLSAWMQKPKYESRLTFALYENSDVMGGALSLAAEFGLNISGGGQGVFAGENILGIITSRRIIENVLLRTDTLEGKVQTMASYYNQIDKAGKQSNEEAIAFPVGLDRKKYSYKQDSLLYRMYEKIVKSQLVATKPDRKLNVYEVKITSGDERFSKIFTDLLLHEVNTFYTEIKSKRSRETLKILEDRVAELKGSLGGAISQRSSIRDANLNPAFAVAEGKLQQKQVEITTYGAAYAELFKNLELARYQYLKDIPLVQVIDEPRYPLKKIKNGRLLTGIIFAIVGAILSVCYIFLSMFLNKVKRLAQKNTVESPV